MMDDVYEDDYISDVSSVSDIDELSACNEVIHHVTCFLNWIQVQITHIQIHDLHINLHIHNLHFTVCAVSSLGFV